MCPSQIRPKSLPEAPGPEDQGLAAVPRDSSLVSAGDRPAGTPSPALPASPSGPAARPQPGLPAEQKLPVPPGRAARPSQSPRRPFNSIIEHLAAALPGYSRCGAAPLQASLLRGAVCPFGVEREGPPLLRREGGCCVFCFSRGYVFRYTLLCASWENPERAQNPALLMLLRSGTGGQGQVVRDRRLPGEAALVRKSPG